MNLWNQEGGGLKKFENNCFNVLHVTEQISAILTIHTKPN